MFEEKRCLHYLQKKLLLIIFYLIVSMHEDNKTALKHYSHYTHVQNFVLMLLSYRITHFNIGINIDL